MMNSSSFEHPGRIYTDKITPRGVLMSTGKILDRYHGHLGHFLTVKVDESCIPLDFVILQDCPYLLGRGMKKYENI